MPGWLLMGSWWERLFGVVAILFLLSVVGFEVYTFRKTGRLRSVPFMVLIGASIVGAIQMIFRIRGTEGGRGGTTQLFFTPRGASMRRGPGEARLIPWERFRSLRFQRLRRHKGGKDSWHLRLNFPFLSFQLTWKPVEVFIECTRREAALVRNEIRRRLRAAKSS